MTNTALFTDPSLAWLNTAGKHSDIALASRIRLARNLKTFRFPTVPNAPI